ncbi:two-component system histidine kinase PnpS [Corticicoccus populi]|uniref:Sensor protein kinase WalK n=1 Tax=Corticicoccus populi TaxID=1812821 RepID=A0ABW5WY58_9STAP
MKRLWLRISVSFSLLTLSLLIILWFIIASVSKTTYTDTIREHLVENAVLFSEMISTSNLLTQPDELDALLTRAEEDINMRITVISPEGSVIADSENNPGSMTDHIDRPEINEALEGADVAESIRNSETGGINMMYIAVPVYDADDNITGIVRTSYSLELISDTTQYLWQGLAAVLGIVLIISIIVAVFLARSITKPISEVVKATGELREKNYSHRIHGEYKGEMDTLAQSVNALAASLQTQLKIIRENEQQLNSILDNLVSGVMLVNAQGTVEMINPSMERFLSRHRDNILNKHFNEYGENIGLSALIHTVFEENEKVNAEITSYYPNEQKFDAHISPYYKDSWQQGGVIIVLHDITEIRHLEQIRSDFVANVSHELKTPVTSVKGFAETLLSDDVTDKDTERQFLQIILDESERLDRLIQDLLHLSKIEKNTLPLNIEQIEIRQFIKEIVQTLSTSVKKKNIQLTLPSTEKETFLEGDKDRLNQIIINLVSNAVNYSYDYGFVEIKVKAKNNNIYISVSDNGVGIPEESLSRIFERFYRVDKARSRHSGGTGLGLAIVKHLVESHHGRIKVESIENKGTTMTVILPRQMHP